MEFREFLPKGPAHAVMHVPTCNISYRRNLIGQYGGFPDSYYPQEDLLFNHLLYRNGFTVWFDPAIRVKHLRTTMALCGFMQWETIKRPSLLLVLLLGSIWWARGFAAGALTGLSGIRGVIDPEENIFILINQSDYESSPNRNS